MLRGLVTKSTGSWYQVLAEDNQRYECRIKGKFRIKGIKTTNPIAVGDRVMIEPEQEEGFAVINTLEPRKNYIIRRSINLSKQTQIIGANLDQALLVVTLASPPTSMGFIDRFLVTAEAYSIPAVLVFNKLDLFSDEGLEILRDYKSIYTNIGYTCLEVSALEGTNLTTLHNLLQDKITLVSGHSGVGKSTLINALIPDISLKTGQISAWSDKGKHTTTFAEMLTLPFGGSLIDTPGIRELGVVDIEPQELSHFFPEMRALMNQCRFNNCRHVNEPGCAVIAAVEEQDIDLSRYESYLSIYHNEDSRH
ncbi:ribosome small subunit-dependent GTPase A [Sphingobacterium sp. lm-10]|uniref:ribosome small subunit-dependent GTPase A n=1 Tax=Sphingobacterium sp. lm-10 TaxID=2944904 RepID=UPI0020218B64|nr:ribosome small subunit-dependent GTPase A [Sphingobacterium sp. lm-10]MCL7988366.1 ribosome small subunit-dependent GTPase A [Sphingobacterium sp. lm-10]